jgi:hypothetical protein
MRRARLLLGFWLVVVAAAQEASVSSLVRTLRDAVTADQAMADMRRIWETDRWFTFPKFEETARNVAAMLRRAGLEQVEIVHPPADGVTQYGYWTMPLAWDARQATLELLGSHSEVLCDYQKVPTSLGMWSGPTPPEGVTAEIIEAEGSLESLDVKGKLVLTRRNPAGLKFPLARKGALGAINAFTENPDLAGERQWINAWGDNGWGFTKSSTPLLCFSITPNQAARLRRLLAAGPVRARARVDSRYYAGAYPYVTGVIRGTDANAEEVLTLGHLFEQGAHDNATGVAAMIGSLETLHRLVQAGKLPRPRRSIRILAMGECYGTMHYVVSNPERVRRTVAAVCLDTPAAPQNLAGTEYTWYLNPHAAKSFTDAFIIRLAQEYFPAVRRPWHWKEYMSGTDNFLGDPLIGVPTVWPYSGTGVHTHHNSADTPDTVDARSLRDLIVVNAAYLYYLAAAGPVEARLLAQYAATRGYQEIAAAATRALENREGPARIQYALARETQAVRSAARLGAQVDDLAASLSRFAGDQERRLGPNPPPAAPPHPSASKIVVRRKRPGTITLDDLPPDQRQGYPAASFSGPPVTALYWCDGRRTLDEVIRLTELELGPVKFDFVGYFQFLEKRGYVEFVK